MILTLPIVAGMVAFYVSVFIMQPVYEANTTLYVINRNSNAQQIGASYNDIMVGQMLVKDYRELVKSRTVTGIVIDELKLEGITEVKLASKISVNLKNDTRILEIKVQDPNREAARRIADKTAEVFIRKAIQLMKVENVDVVDKAQLPVTPVKPKPLTNIAIAMLLGLFTAVGTVFLMEYLDDSLKTVEDVEQKLGLTVLGTIPVMDIK